MRAAAPVWKEPNTCQLTAAVGITHGDYPWGRSVLTVRAARQVMGLTDATAEECVYSAATMQVRPRPHSCNPMENPYCSCKQASHGLQPQPLRGEPRPQL